ncbi:ionotropic receptor 25a isoform X2 [Eurytemora carolleeae]|uniref:ionotropic receptor 25a isoform X2 n=1 Tax=Eurytemora carolleeae TaxID=1294199 RepID=UPI000C75B452|nr:ionotropic receptor 25a isoform X2 [Eurytemora carolleeae]|eukprot:XP_023336240.1 ionotropic receptor 25a-like isoform X2 [Eurytemora affinis]
MGGGYNTSTTYKEVVMKRSFRIGVVLGKPWAWVSGAKEDKQTNPKSINNALKNKGLEGYTLDLLDEVSKAMHFDYEIVIATGNDYGARDPVTSQWSGLMGDLISGNIDISLASLIMTTEREEYVDFVTPYFDQSGISILLREKYVERNMFKFFLVLQDEVWLGILGCVLVVILILWILDRFSPYSYVNNREAYPEGAREFTFGECIWFCLTSLTPQGGGECPKALSARVLVAAYWLFIVLMLATFTSNLAALLTVERMQTTVQSLEDLARQSQVNYTVLEGSPTMEYFKNMAGAEEELYRKWKELTLNSSAESNKFRVWDYPIREQYTHIWDVIKSGNPVKSPEEGYNRVKESQKGLFAFISDASEIKYQYYTNCEFLEIGEPFAEQPLAIAVQEGSSLSKELSQVVLGLQKDRFFEKVHSKFWNIGQRQACPVMNDNQGITLESLGGIFLTTLVGLALSVLMLIYEIYQEKKEEQIAKIQPMLFKNRQDEKMYGDLDKPTYTLSGDMTRSSRKLADVD